MQPDPVLMNDNPPPLTLRTIALPLAAMIVVIIASNFLVQFPINGWLTWAAFSYPLVFLVTDLTNRTVGARVARCVALIGFPVAVLVSLALAPWRIAAASGSAFLVSQFLDITVFNRWRRQSWWKSPLFGSAAGSVIDTAVFFSIAFAGTRFNGFTLGLGDLSVKWLMAALLLAPYRAALPYLFRLWLPEMKVHA